MILNQVTGGNRSTLAGYTEVAGQGKPAIALSGPAGIAAATPASLTLAAGEHVDSVARQNQQVTAGQKVVINAGSDIGLFAQGGELRQITHQGPMLLQAQKNDIRLDR